METLYVLMCICISLYLISKQCFCSIEKVRSWTSDDRRKAWSQEKEISRGQRFIPWRTQECECCSILQWFHYIFLYCIGIKIHSYLSMCKMQVYNKKKIMNNVCIVYIIKMKLSALKFGTNNNFQRPWQLHQCKELYKISQVIYYYCLYQYRCKWFFLAVWKQATGDWRTI